MPHKHEYIRIICHTRTHAVTYCATQAIFAALACMQCLVCHTSMHTVALCATYACIPLHNPSYMLACRCIICHIATHVAAQCTTTQARMQWQNPPHIHASIGTSFTHRIWCLRDARACEPQNESGTARGDACLFIMTNHLVQQATRRRSSISSCRSKAQKGKWQSHILCKGEDYAQGGGGGGGMRASTTWSTRPQQVHDCPNPCHERRGRSQQGPKPRCRMGCASSSVAELTVAGHACTSQLVL